MDTCDFGCVDNLCQLLQKIDLIVFVYFAIEMLIKMVAMGVIGQKSYLSQPWNIFDFIICVVGSTEYVYMRGGSDGGVVSKGGINFSVIRTFRVLRPLRAINRIPSLKILVELLLESLPMLGNVLVFAFFIFFVFGVCGIQLWAGILRNRCYFPQTDSFHQWITTNNFTHFYEEMPAFYQRPSSPDFVCSPLFGMLQCSDIADYEEEASICYQLFHGEEVEFCQILVSNYTDCRPDAANPSRDSVSFDNIGAAWIAIFQVINLESWTEVMYFIQDAYSFWVWIYFVILIVVSSSSLFNFCPTLNLKMLKDWFIFCFESLPCCYCKSFSRGKTKTSHGKSRVWGHAIVFVWPNYRTVN